MLIPVHDMQPMHERVASGAPHDAHIRSSFRSSIAIALPWSAAAIVKILAFGALLGRPRVPRV